MVEDEMNREKSMDSLQKSASGGILIQIPSNDVYRVA